VQLARRFDSASLPRWMTGKEFEQLVLATISSGSKQRKATLRNKMKLNRRDVAQTPLLKSNHAQLRRSHRQGDTVTFGS